LNASAVITTEVARRASATVWNYHHIEFSNILKHCFDVFKEWKMKPEICFIDLSIKSQKLYLIYHNKRKNLIYLLWFVYTRRFQKCVGEEESD
jgi:hypothetical protein